MIPRGFKNYWKKYENMYEKSIGAVISRETVVEQYGIKTLHEHRASLEQKARFSDFPCVLRYLPTEITQELAS